MCVLVEPAEQQRPSYDELLARVAEQDVRIAALEELVAELSRKFGVDSRNSSKPPSSDGPGSRAERRRAERERRTSEPAEGRGEKRGRGGQAGHAGRGLEFTAVPDAVEVIEPDVCGSCHAGLDHAAAVRVERVQVVDIPEAEATVTELRVVSRRCGCGRVSAGVLPAGVPGGRCATGRT